MNETFNPDLFVAKWYCSRVLPEDMPTFAADALEAGYDGPALRRLAGLQKPSTADVGDLFQKSLVEIGRVKIKSQDQAIVFLSRLIAKDIVEDRLDPVQGAEVLAEYAQRLGYPPFLAEFLGLADMPMWGEYAPTRKALVELIMTQAQELLDNVPE
jgi:hypothetical protein